jgi:O-antigen/teichoic acid export membrane protein/O-antigen ligase
LRTSLKHQPSVSRMPGLRTARIGQNLALEGIRLRAVGGTMAARITSSAFSLGAGIIAARLGLHGRAILAILIAVPALFSIVSVLGLDNANARFAGRSHSAFRQIVRRSVVFSAVAGTGMAAAWWYAGSVWPGVRLGLDPRQALLSATLCPVSLLFTLLGTAEIGRGRVVVYNLATTITSAAYLAGTVVLLASGHLTIDGCFAACAISQLLGCALLLVLAATRVHEDGERIALRSYGSYAFRAYLPNLAQYGMLRMDVPVIQILAGTTAVALYAIALPVAEAVMLLPTAVALVMFPQVTAGAVGQAAADRISNAVVAASAVLAGLVGLAAPVCIPLVYGASFRGAVPVIWMMLPGMLFFSIGRTPQAYLAATDRLGRVIVATAGGIATCLIALFVLTPRFGAAGAGAADSIGYLTFTAIVLGRHRLTDPARLAQHGARQSARVSIRRTQDALRSARAQVTAEGLAQTAAFVLVALAAGYAPMHLRLAVSFAAVVIILAWPGTGLILLAVALPLSQTDFGASMITSKDQVILLLACLIGRAVTGHVRRPGGWGAAAAVSLVGYVLLSLALADGGANAGADWRTVLLLGAPLLCVPVLADSDKGTRRALLAFGLAAACLAVAEILKSHASLAATSGLTAAASAMVAADQTGAVNHNAEGAVFVMGLAVLLSRYPRTRSAPARLVLAIAIAVLVLGIAFSFSRSSYFGAVVVITVFGARRSLRGLAGAAAIVGGLAAVLPSAVGARLATVWNSSNLDASSTVRIDLWSSALRMFETHPVFGVGYLNFSSQLPAYYINTGTYDSSLVQFAMLDFAHNTYLTVLAQTGLAGFCLVGFLAVVGWRKAWSASRAGDWVGEAAFLSFAGMGVCSVFGEVLFVPAILAAFLLIIMAAGHPRRGANSAVPGRHA